MKYKIMVLLTFYLILTNFLLLNKLYTNVITINNSDELDIFKKLDKNDTVILKPGIYYLNIKLNDGIDLIGENNVILRPLSDTENVITKTGSGTINNITIENGTININNSNAIITNSIFRNSTGNGIYLSFFTGKIDNCIIENNLQNGIKAYNSTGLITNSIIKNNLDDGIQALESKLSIDSVTLKNNSDNGIELWFDKGTLINNCIFIKNNREIYNVTSAVSPTIYDTRKSDNDKSDDNKSDDDKSDDDKSDNDKSDDDKSDNDKSDNDKSDNDKSDDDKSDDNKSDDNKSKDDEFIKINNSNSQFSIKDFIIETKRFKISDFNLNYNNSSCPLEIPFFTQLYKNTLDTPETMRYISDYIKNNNAHDIINFLIENDSPTTDTYQNEYYYKNFTNKTISEITLPDFLPFKLQEHINKIIKLTYFYNQELIQVKNNYTKEDFNFIVKNITELFGSENGLQLNIREQLENSNKRNDELVKLVELLKKLDLTKLKIIGNEIIYYAEKISEINFDHINIEKINQETIFEKYVDFGKIIIAGKTDNHHENSDCFILIDLGGNNYYRNDIARANLEKPVSLYFDFGGDDIYYSNQNFDLVSSVFGVSYLYNKSGNNKYSGKSNSIAATYFGIAILRDDNGNDFYEGHKYCIGAATFGYAILIDNAGNDIYQGGLYCQGFAAVKGYGIIKEMSGNDYYLSGNYAIDTLRYEANSITMSQGFGFGLRPHLPGGLGMIVEVSGNDFYRADIFGQGASYWKAIGCIVDYSGDDHYISHRYSQGAGIHLSIGLLYDIAGNDNYISYSVSQGCGHDLAFGMLYDKSGNDFYKNYHLGMGAGNANGIGILFDGGGNDGYFGLRNTHGAGVFLEQRQFGSIGILIDADGDDTYLKYENRTFKLKDRYGIFYDR